VYEGRAPPGGGALTRGSGRAVRPDEEARAPYPRTKLMIAVTRKNSAMPPRIE
jgi:hypothetical protein